MSFPEIGLIKCSIEECTVNIDGRNLREGESYVTHLTTNEDYVTFAYCSEAHQRLHANRTGRGDMDKK